MLDQPIDQHHPGVRQSPAAKQQVQEQQATKDLHVPIITSDSADTGVPLSSLGDTGSFWIRGDIHVESIEAVYAFDTVTIVVVRSIYGMGILASKPMPSPSVETGVHS